MVWGKIGRKRERDTAGTAQYIFEERRPSYELRVSYQRVQMVAKIKTKKREKENEKPYASEILRAISMFSISVSLCETHCPSLYHPPTMRITRSRTLAKLSAFRA